MPYLLIINYGSDAERKRIDYAIERWREKLKIRKPKGAIAILDGDKEDFETFFEDLLSRIELKGGTEGKVEIYTIEEFEPDVEKREKVLTFSIPDKGKGWVEGVIQSLMAKINASYEFTSPTGKVYTAYTKKGQARVEVISAKDGKLIISIEGYGKVVDFISKKIEKEMRHLEV
ncbi:hypothetical protein [Archaeoglobus sp.]